MKFDCGLTWEDKKAKLESWHRWFAWRPIKIGSHDCRWLETIERKGTYCSIPYYCAVAALLEWSWEYRAIDK